MRRNSLVRISQRMTLAHWLMSSGRSRYELVQRENAAPMMVSEVGRMTYGSVSLPAGIIFVVPSSCFSASSR